MAVKRLTKFSINWQLLSDTVPADQRAKLNNLRAKHELFARKCIELPLEPPKIDWKFFEDRISVKGMVSNFQKEYESFKVPYPPETASPKIDAYEKEVKTHIETFKKESKERIVAMNKELEYINSLIPYDQMTMDDFYDAFPKEALDTFNNPTFWPHLPQDQVGYVEKPKEEVEAAKPVANAAPKALPPKKDKKK